MTSFLRSIPKKILLNLLGMFLRGDVNRDAVRLTTPRRPCQSAHTMAEQAEALESEPSEPSEPSERLGAALVDAEPALRRLAERLCENSVDARDLLQDTFERALRQGIPSEVRVTGAWLGTIMHNLFMDRCRAAARRPNHEALEDKHGNVAPLDPDTSEPAWAQITIQDVYDALDLIEQVYGDVFRLHTFKHLSYEQIAQQLSIQRITVGTRLTRARKRLR